MQAAMTFYGPFIVPCTYVYHISDLYLSIYSYIDLYRSIMHVARSSISIDIEI
jgi:hypothetical protein